MDYDLKDKIVIVTGSSKGIGFSIAKKYIEQGSVVILNGRDKDALTSSSRKLNNAPFFACDVSSPKGAEELTQYAVKNFGRLDILVCNVGSGKSVPSGQETYEEWQRVFAQNFWSTTSMVEASKVHLVSVQGVIVCISSICGREFIPGAPLTYSVAKSALNSYVKGVSHDLGKNKVRINAICPGNILFEGSVWDRKLNEGPKNVHAYLEQNVPLNQLGTPEDISELCLYLSSSASRFATGGIWVIDGGQTRSF